MEMAAVLDSCHARAQAAEAQVAQLMQMMELNQQNQAQGVAPPGFGWPSQSHLSASEAQFQQRALQQTLEGALRSGTAPIPRDKFPEDAEGSPISDASQANGKIQNQLDQERRRLAKKLKPKQTLRGYLEELRSEDPRCIFIVRRINKLGFRSKSSLESHYQKYGKVLQVCVAHSKVKPLPNTGQTARTRPGNFGLVVMQDPAAVDQVLLQGSIHKIDGVEVSVQKYQPSGDNDEVEENDEEEPKVGHDVGGPSIENKAQVSQVGSSSGSTQTGGSSQGSHSGKSSGINSGDADDWNRQDSSGSNGSSQITSASIEGKDLSQDAWTSSAAPSTWASPLPPSEQLSDWNIASEGDKAQKFLIPFSVRELQELHSLLQFKSARDNEAELANILGKLQQLLQEQSAQSHFSTDHIMQAASLISVAKQLVHADCMAKMESLNASMGSQMPFERHLRTPGFDGLGLPDVSAQAMAMLQAQQQLQLWQSQVGAHAGAAPLPPPPFSDIASWMKSLGTPPSDALPSTGAADPLLPMTVPHDAPEEDVDENQELQMDTLKNYLKELNGEDASCMFVVRRVSRLGFKCEEVLHQTFAKFGKVKKVLVTKGGKTQRRGPLRSRVAALGIVVMDSAAAVKKILSQGEEQLIGGQILKVQGFEKTPKAAAKARPTPFKVSASSEQPGSSSSGSGENRQPQGGSSGYDMEGEGCSSGSGQESQETPDQATPTGGLWFM